MGLSEQFFDGDIEAGYAYELEPTGITLEAIEERPRRHFPSRRTDL